MNLQLIPPEKPQRRSKSATRSSSGQNSKSKSRSAAVSSTGTESSEISSTEEYSYLNHIPDLKILDRVVWPSETGYERATVRWIGTLDTDDENTYKGEILIGVEFVSPKTVPGG